MGKLYNHLKKSQIPVIKINFAGEAIEFNLSQEVKISEIQLNSEIIKQPSKYGFALLLWGKLKTRFENSKVTKKRVYGRLYAKAKSQKMGNTGRPMSDDLAKSWVESHEEYCKACRACIKAKDEVDQLYSVVKAFEQRAFLLQTISSNKRNES